jgi:hypothetical protein
MDLFPREIMFYKHNGQGFKALCKALSFSDPATTGLYGLFRKISMILLAILPFCQYQWLRERYKNSFMITLVHRLQEKDRKASQ